MFRKQDAAAVLTPQEGRSLVTTNTNLCFGDRVSFIEHLLCGDHCRRGWGDKEGTVHVLELLGLVERGKSHLMTSTSPCHCLLPARGGSDVPVHEPPTHLGTR